MGIIALALHGGTSASAGEPASSASEHPVEDGFEAWASREASLVGGAVSALTEVELDGEPGTEMAARICHDDGWSETLLVQRQGHRWRIPHASWGHTQLCASSSSGVQWVADPEDNLSLLDIGPGSMSRRKLAIVEDDVVVTSQWSAEGTSSVNVRWDLASHRDHGRQGRIIRVRRGNAVEPEQGATFLLSGQSNWSGVTDGDLRVVAERREDGSVILRVALDDDDRKVGLSGDRITVWWVDPSQAKRGGLDIRTDANGRLRTIPLGTQKLPLQVHGTVHNLEVVLDWTLASAELGSRIRLTVVAQDVDDDGTTALATSQYDGRHVSLGELRYFPGGGNFPVAGHRVANASHLDGLPRHEH